MRAIAEKHVVVISNDFAKPAIKIDVVNTEIAVSTSLNEFLASLVEAYGNPARTLTKAQLLRGLTAAAEAVTSSMKKETARVM